MLLEEASVRRDVDRRNAEGSSALHVACRGGHHRLVEMLVNAGADVSSRDAGCRSSLFIACEVGCVNTVRVLVLQGGADMHERDVVTGYVPLHVVAHRGYVECVGLLLSLHAAVHPRCNGGYKSVSTREYGNVMVTRDQNPRGGGAFEKPLIIATKE